MMRFTENAQRITLALKGVWHGHYGLARCPAHNDKKPSLSLSNLPDGRLLLHCFSGCNFMEVIDALCARGLMNEHGLHELRPAKMLTNVDLFLKQSNHRKAGFACHVWTEATPIYHTLGEHYLRQRAITCALPPSLRFHPNCRHPSGKSLPAMIALIEGGAGFAIHRTYLSRDGKKAEIMPAKAMLGAAGGGAVKLCDCSSNRIVVCEGIETGLSLASGLLESPAQIWAALSTSGMMALDLPLVTGGDLIITMDGDKAGYNAGFSLAQKARQSGWNVRVAYPPKGQDFNDLLFALVKGGVT